MSALSPADVAALTALRIDVDLLRLAGVRRVDDRTARDVLGLNGKPGDFSGIEFPYFAPDGARRFTSRIRLDHPPVKADGTPEGKYRTPYGDWRHLYFAPGAAALLDDCSVPVVIVEAEKSVLALTSAAARTGRPLLVIGLGGCWGWKGRIGKADDANGKRVDVTGPLPDFDRLTWAQRDTLILFDARPNTSVTIARRQLARELRGRDAAVRHAHLPDEDLRINGPDDFLGQRTDDALFRMLDVAMAEDFVCDAKGRIVAENLDNVRLALSTIAVRLTYDAFANLILVNDTPIDDYALDDLWVRIDDTCGFRPRKETLLSVLFTEAHKRTVHPVKRYLDALTWDGAPRLDTWLSRYAGAADTPYTRAVGALPLLAAVRRVRHPGAKFDELLILESPQGAMKSTALRTLCPHDGWFSDDLPLGVDSKVVIERTAGRWILEAAELHGNRGRESEALKTFLSRQNDGPVRLAYGRLPVSVPRQFVLIGSTNNHSAYLKDMTGARRFWPVSVRTFDIDALRRDRDQIWAEAAAREGAGASIRLNPDLWRLAEAEQEDRRAGDPWEDVLDHIFEGDGIVVVDYVPVASVWAALKLEANHLDNKHADRVAAIAQRYGFIKKRRLRVGGKPTLCWVRENDPQNV